MRALLFDTRLRFESAQLEPSRDEGDTLIRVLQAGICATDLEITRGYMGFRGVLGHEFVGRVMDSPRKDLIDQRVVGEINLACGRCDLCMAGLSIHCRHRLVLGIQNHNGCFADLVRLPGANLHTVSKGIDDDSAVFVEPLAAAFQILKQISPDSRKWITILGDGRLGLLCAQVLRNTGAPVRMIGKHPEKLALCEKWGIRARLLADISPRHDQDIVVDCTGSAEGLELAMQIVRPRGTIVLKSTAAAGKAVNLAPVVIDEIQVLGSRCGPFREAIQALAEKSVDVISLISKRMKIEQGVEAMQYAGRPGILKVLLTME